MIETERGGKENTEAWARSPGPWEPLRSAGRPRTGSDSSWFCTCWGSVPPCRGAGGTWRWPGNTAAAVPSTSWDLWASDVPLHTFLYFPHLQCKHVTASLRKGNYLLKRKKKKWEAMSICHCWDCRFLVTLRFPLVTLSSKNSVQGNDRRGNDFLFASGKKCL